VPWWAENAWPCRRVVVVFRRGRSRVGARGAVVGRERVAV
jgi:hypothetical protein